MAQGIPILKDAPYNVLTVPNYVHNLVVTTKPAQVIAAYTAPPGVEAWTVYRPSAEGVPAHPYDGWRVVTPLSEDAETTVAATLTEHIVNDTEYVVRVFIQGRLGFQTRVGGAVATATPVAALPVSEFELGTLIKLKNLDDNFSNWPVVDIDHAYPGMAVLTNDLLAGSVTISQGSNEYTTVLKAKCDAVYASLSEEVRAIIQLATYSYLSSNTAKALTGYTFAPSKSEMEGGLSYFDSAAKRIARDASQTAKAYPLRDNTSVMQGYYVKATGEVGTMTNQTTPIRVIFIIPMGTLVSAVANPDGSYSPIL